MLRFIFGVWGELWPTQNNLRVIDAYTIEDSFCPQETPILTDEVSIVENLKMKHHRYNALIIRNDADWLR